MMITNQVAGTGNAKRLSRNARHSFHGAAYDFRSPHTADELREVCRTLVPGNYSGVFFIGGDGTLHQALPVLAGGGIPVGILPGGTANDLATELGMCGASWENILKVIDDKNPKPMDLIRMNQSLFATVGGIGIGAILTHEFNCKRKSSPTFRWLGKTLGSDIYTVLSAKSILTRRDYIHNLQVTAPEYQGKVRTSALFVCNQAKLGGDLSVAPKAVNSDGKFDVLILTQTSQTSLLKGLLDLKSGRLPPGAIQFSTKHLVIQDLDGRAIRAFGDGEALQAESRLEFSIVPAALSVYRFN